MNSYSPSPSRRLETRKSSTFARRRRVSAVLGRLAIPVVLVMAIFLLSRLLNAGFLSVNNVEVLGADADIAGLLRIAAMKSLEGNYLYIFSRADTLIYPKGSVAAAVMAGSPRIESVAVTRQGFHGLAVTVNEKTPSSSRKRLRQQVLLPPRVPGRLILCIAISFQT